MPTYRAILIDLLRRVVAGGDLTNDELSVAIPDPVNLRGAERKAWHGLSYWADDEDVRAKDLNYGPERRRQLADLLDDLDRA